jgi:hypothetical protein
LVGQCNACVTRFADVRGTEIALHTVDGFEPFNASTALTGLTNPAIAFPLDVGHLPRRNISFERTEAADGSFPSLQGNFVVARRQRHPKSALVIRDE